MKIIFELFLIVALSVLSGCGNFLIYDLNATTGKPIPYQTTPNGLTGISAKECGVCHQAIYSEWKTSMHSKAFSDPFFKAYWRKDKFEWSCLNCHTPLENQLKQKVTFQNGNYSSPIFFENPEFDQQLQEEGITCAACHLRGGIIYGPYKSEELNSPHPVAFDKRFLSEEICLDCHQVPAKRFSFLRSAICSTGNEWENGPYKKEGYTCQSCHMPEIFREVAVDATPKKARKHLWDGGSKVEQVKKALTVNVTKDTNHVLIDIINSGAGHFFPTGDPDRKVFIKIDLVDHDSKILETEIVKLERVILWKPIMVELWDSRIAPRGTKSVKFRVPEKVSKSGKIKIKAEYQILSDGAKKKLETKYGLKDYPPVRYTFFEKEYLLSLVTKINL